MKFQHPFECREFDRNVSILGHFLSKICQITLIRDSSNLILIN